MSPLVLKGLKVEKNRYTKNLLDLMFDCIPSVRKTLKVATLLDTWGTGFIRSLRGWQ